MNGVDHVAALQMSAVGIFPKKAIVAPFLRVQCALGVTGKGLFGLM